jgi:hypothetical protein
MSFSAGLLAAMDQFLRKSSDYADFAESMASTRSIPPLRVDSRGGSRDAALRQLPDDLDLIERIGKLGRVENQGGGGEQSLPPRDSSP